MQNANFWKSLLGAQAVYQTAKLPTGAQARGKIELTSGFSTTLAVLAAATILLLALNEWWAEPFRYLRRAV